MKAVESNILVYAHRDDSPFQPAAFRAIKELAEGGEDWAIPWPCVHEFVAVVTNRRIFPRPSTLPEAFRQIEAWRTSASLRFLAEGPGYFEHFAATAAAGRVTGARVHDARIAAICLYHGVSELLTADRDFARFPALKTRNPLLAV